MVYGLVAALLLLEILRFQMVASLRDALVLLRMSFPMYLWGTGKNYSEFE